MKKNISNILTVGPHLPYEYIDNNQNNNPEHNRSELLKEILYVDYNLFENNNEKFHKENVLISLNNIILLWIKNINKKLKRKDTAKLLCFGSYKLGVSNPGGDIDALVLAPNYVNRNEHFFGDLYNILFELSLKGKNIKDLTSINLEHTIMPLIKMTYENIQIDLVFASVNEVSSLDNVTEELPLLPNQIRKDKFIVRSNLYNNSIINFLDEKMKRSYNGFRNAEMILNSVSIICSTESERKDKIQKFRYLLKFIKLWAKKKGIDSNKSGYLGGIAWAILCAKIVQLFPNYSEYFLIEKFFYIYGEYWKWDEWIVEIEKEQLEDNKPIKNRYMHILTPSYPQMNSSYNINYSSRKIILGFMKEGYQIINKHKINEEYRGCIYNEDNNYVKSIYNEILKEFDFFNEYENFVEIIILGQHMDSFLKWRGFVEAKLRILIEKLEELLLIYNIKFHLWPFKEEFDLNNKTNIDSNQYFKDSYILKNYYLFEKIYIGVKVYETYTEPIDFNIPVIKFLEQIEFEWRRENKRRDPDELNILIHSATKNNVNNNNTNNIINKNTTNNIEIYSEDYYNIIDNLNIETTDKNIIMNLLIN